MQFFSSRRRLACLVLLLLSLTPASWAASFDCDQAASDIERRICASESLSRLDAQLGEEYQSLRSLLDEPDRSRLLGSQRQWISQRNQCRDNACLERLYQTRLDALNDRLLRHQYQGQPMKVTSVQEESWENGAALVARLTVPVDAETDWRRYLKVSRGSLIQPEDAWVLSDDRKALIYPFLDPSSTYTLDIEPGMTGINGKTLVEASTQSIETRRTQPSASFTDNGQVLAMALKRALPVTTLNIDEVDLDLFRIAPERIGEWSRYTDAERRHYNQLNQFAKHNTLVHSARFTIEHRANQRTMTNLDLSDISALDEPGAYLAVLTVPGQYDYRFETSLFTVSDIGLQVRRNDRQLRVYTHSISSGLSRDDVTLELYDNNNLIGRQPVDAEGVAVFDAFFKKGHTLLARHGRELTILRYDRSPLDLSAYQNAVTRHAPHQVFAWGPRDLYRPGETFDVYALLKDYDGRGVDTLPLNLMLFDATGSRITTRTVNVGANGRYEFQYRLEDSAKTGRWRVSFALPGQNNVLTEYEFSVEDFQPERLELTLFDGDPSKRRRVSSVDRVTIPVQGDYLYGAPASGNKLDGYVVAEVDRHPFERWKSYYFGLDQESIPNPRHDLAPTELDASGAANLAIGLDNWRAVASPLALTATVSLYESGGRPVTRSTTVTNILSQSLVGVEPQFGPRPEYNSRLAFKTILTDAEGEMLAGEGYRARLMREDRNYYWTYSDSEGWRWHYDPLDYEVFSADLTYDGQSATDFVMPVTWGQYRLEVRDADNNLVNRFRFRTGWSGWQDTGSDALRPDQVRLSFQRDRYAPGETAAARLVPPVDGHATVTVETNDAVLWQDRIDVSADGTDLQIPIGEDWDRHDIYLTATVLTPGDMVHSVAPKRAFGFIHLPVERPDARLDVEFDLPEKLQPRHTAEATLRLNGDALPTGPVWVSVAAVDVGVLNITRFRTPDPAGYLFGARRYDYHLYDIYGRIIENAGFDYSRQRFGGGFAESAAELARGGEKPSNDVQIVSLQSAAVEFDANGEARVSLDIPEFNGRLRWMAVAWSDRQFGSAEADTQVADPLVTQLSRPRFLAVGDESRLTLDVSNQSGTEQQLAVEFEVTGALATESWSRQLTLAEGEKQTLTFPVAAVGLGQAPIRASISNAAQDAPLAVSREWQLSTRSAYPGVTRKDQAVIDPVSDWTPALAFDDLIASSVQAQLIVSNRPPIDVGSHFDALLRYPYGCTEQTTSSGYPWVLVSPDAADRLGLRKMIEDRFSRGYTEAFRREQIEVAVDRVLTRQASTGGFGLWRSEGEERFWLTVYVADFLTAARDAGASVPNDALNLTLDRLDAYLRDSVSISQRWSGNNDYYRFATQAYAAYVLARSNRVQLSHLRRLMQRSEGDFEESGLPWAHLGYALQKIGDQQQADRAFELARDTTYSQGYYGDYGSELRDTALTYAVLAHAGKADAALLLTVFEQVRERRWLSTQERNALFQAATAGAIGGGDKVRATLVTEAFEQQLDQDDTFRTIIGAADLDSLKAIRNTGETLYASLELVGVPASPPAPVNNEMRVQRDYFDLDGKPVTLQQLNSGDLVMVRLRAGASRSIPDGLVVDLLPAGLELENQNLANASADLSKLSIEGQSVTDWQQQGDIQHVEYRDDRFVAALAISEYRDTHLFYLARAVTPGVYQVPPPYIEDMYRPYYHAIGVTPANLTVLP